MEATANTTSGTARIFQLTILIVGIVGLYYLYQYLFSSSGTSVYTLLSSTEKASASSSITVSPKDTPQLYEGGEFTISMWIYINDWNYRMGMNKHILSIGGSRFDTIRIYLGANQTNLAVRVQTAESSSSGTSADEKSGSSNLARSNFDPTFDTLQMDGGLLSVPAMCDLRELEMQRWINVTVAVNGKTCDVYLDGKLARSCVLPSNYKVDHGYKATLLSNGGFGGYLSTVTMYNTALNPDVVYRNYMAGPTPITNIWSYVMSIFKPSPSKSM